MRYATLLFILCLNVTVAFGEESKQMDPSKCPMHQEHMKQAMDARGDRVMGFSQAKTKHHFQLASEGGTIEVDATDPRDEESIGLIRKHLKMVASDFSDGKFAMAEAIHLQIPPGAVEMQRQKNEIRYNYEETELGAKVHIQSNQKSAVEAIHEFLKFQIQEHETGDPLE